MKAIRELLDALTNEVLASKWSVGGKAVINAYQEEEELIVELEGGYRITLRAHVDGEVLVCPACKEKKGGWPGWWRNVASEVGRLIYGCADCVIEAESRRLSEAEAQRPQQEFRDQAHCSRR